MRPLRYAAPLSLALASACSDSSEAPARPESDASLDGLPLLPDAFDDVAPPKDGPSEDGSSDASDAGPPPPRDTGGDRGVDGTVDAPDGSPDARPDARDTGVDVTPDTSKDAPVDSPKDVAADVPSGPTQLRVYVAGESIEEYNVFHKAPFTAAGALTSPSDNNRNEYGWMVPFADRLKLRDAGLSLTWVGSREWIAWNDNWTATYPSSKREATSAYSGTTVERWLQYMEEELDKKTFCYDVAIAARSGNDANEDVSGATFRTQLKILLRKLDAGSSCRTHPLILVTGHMPDNGGWSGSRNSAWVSHMRQYFDTWPKQVIAELAASAQASDRAIRVRFVDGFNPFVNNQPTTAFPAPNWLNGDGVPEIDTITWDNYHPKRLASIYFGEVVADAVDLAELRTIK